MYNSLANSIITVVLIIIGYQSDCCNNNCQHSKQVHSANRPSVSILIIQ